MADGIVTYGERAPVDAELAAEQHAAYVAAVADAGWEIREVEHADPLPDSAFVEDTLVVCGGLAVLTRPGAPERRAELAGSEEAVRALGLELARIEEPGTLDGGDVLVMDGEVYVGRSTRTNDSGIEQLRRALEPLGYRVTVIAVTRCLHLKAAVTRVAAGTLLVNPAWVASDAFTGYRRLTVDPAEPAAANALAIGGAILLPAQHLRTRARLEATGLAVIPVPMTELAKAEAGITCCSILLEVP